MRRSEPIECPSIRGLTIASPSWKRGGRCTTHTIFDGVNYVVAQSQRKDYAGEGANLWVCPDSAQGNLCRVRNWILDHCPTRWLLILDDDLQAMCRWQRNVAKTLGKEEAMEAIEAAFSLADEMGVKMWGVNLMVDKSTYREYTPFSLSAVVCGPLQGFIEQDLRYDEALPLKEDYDLSLQTLNKYRRILRINFLGYRARQHNNEGGCAQYRTMRMEREQLQKLRAKWGSEIVRDDPCVRNKGAMKPSKRHCYDINPIVVPPIKGV